MSFWPFNRPKGPMVDIVVTQSLKTKKFFNLVIDSETGKQIAISTAKHTEDSKDEAIAEAEQMSRVRKIIVDQKEQT